MSEIAGKRIGCIAPYGVNWTEHGMSFSLGVEVVSELAALGHLSLNPRAQRLSSDGRGVVEFGDSVIVACLLGRSGP